MPGHHPVTLALSPRVVGALDLRGWARLSARNRAESAGGMRRQGVLDVLCMAERLPGVRESFHGKRGQAVCPDLGGPAVSHLPDLRLLHFDLIASASQTPAYPCNGDHVVSRVNQLIKVEVEIASDDLDPSLHREKCLTSTLPRTSGGKPRDRSEQSSGGQPGRARCAATGLRSRSVSRSERYP